MIPARLRLRAALPLGRAAVAASRALGRGRGSVIGGHVILAVAPDAARGLLAGRDALLVTGTNGKTTTTRMLAAALATRAPVVTNLEGANLPTGIVAALARPEAASARAAVLEVDERWLGSVAEAAEPEVVVLLNLSRDQLDRMSEVRTTSTRWREVLERRPATTVVANADDPLIVWAVPAEARATWVAAGLGWKEDAASCPACSERIVFHADGWRCSGCGLSRPDPGWRLDGDTVVAPGGGRVELPVALPGRHTRANAAMAVAAAVAVGVPAEQAAAALSSVTDVDGRYRPAWGPGHQGRLYLAKNPAGWTELLDVLGEDERPVVVAFNANGADGRDPSWLWDVPFERLRGRTVLATGERSHDLAVRLRYADVEHRDEPDLGEALDFGRRTDADVVATYTAFGPVREALRG